MAGKTLFNSTNKATIGPSVYWNTDLIKELKQKITRILLPANAIYVKTVDSSCELELFINDVSGDSYLISAEKDLFLAGINIWNVFIKNNDGSLTVAIGDVTLAVFKTEEEE